MAQDLLKLTAIGRSITHLFHYQTPTPPILPRQHFCKAMVIANPITLETSKSPEAKHTQTQIMNHPERPHNLQATYPNSPLITTISPTNRKESLTNNPLTMSQHSSIQETQRPNGLSKQQTCITNTCPHQEFLSHLSPFGTPMPTIDHTKVLRVCMQNTQHSFQLYGDCLDITSTIDQLKNIGASMFSAISPNINWNNQIN
jgi:hypothetical protein